MFENGEDPALIKPVMKNRSGPGGSGWKKRQNAIDEPYDIPEAGYSKPLALRRSPLKSQVVRMS